ncbi:MAG: hypothetical protein AAGD86_14590 [Pseudomonadota bacterium]
MTLRRGAAAAWLACWPACLLVACGGSDAPAPAFGIPFVIAERESIEFEQAGFTVEFHGVIADSRCPSDARCAWGGNAEIRLLLTTLDEKRSATVTLHTADDARYASARCAFDHTIRLLALDPERVSSGSALLNAYAVTLTLEPGCA